MVKSLIDYKTQWLSDPERNGWLLHPFSGFRRVDPALRYQNVDPKSHWAGAMGTGDSNTKWWKWREDQTPPLNRWDRLKSISTTIVGDKVVLDGPWAGTSLREYGETVALAFAATINGSFQSLLRRSYAPNRLLNRAAAASLSDLLVLGEDEVWRGRSGKCGHRSLSGQFSLCHWTENAGTFLPRRATHETRVAERMGGRIAAPAGSTISNVPDKCPQSVIPFSHRISAVCHRYGQGKGYTDRAAHSPHVSYRN